VTTPPIYSEAFPRENVNVLFRIIRRHVPKHSVRDFAALQVRHQTVAIPQCRVTWSGPRIEHLKGIEDDSEALKRENINKKACQNACLSHGVVWCQ
jgi:hypothetical protein